MNDRLGCRAIVNATANGFETIGANRVTKLRDVVQFENPHSEGKIFDFEPPYRFEHRLFAKTTNRKKRLRALLVCIKYYNEALGFDPQNMALVSQLVRVRTGDSHSHVPFQCR